MFADPEKEQADRSSRLFHAILNLVISPDDPGASAGMVNPDLIRATLADVAATVDENCGLHKTKGERRRLANQIAQRYETMAKVMADSAEQIGWQKAKKIEGGPIN